MVCSFSCVLSDFESFCVCFFFIVVENKGSKISALKPSGYTMLPPKTLSMLADMVDEFTFSVQEGVAPLHVVACVINYSFLKQKLIVLTILWDSLKHMSAQIADRIAPGPLAGESKKPKSAKKQQRAANNLVS